MNFEGSFLLFKLMIQPRRIEYCKDLSQNFDGHIWSRCMICGFGFSVFVHRSLHQTTDSVFHLPCISK